MELVEGEMKSLALALAANFVLSSLISCISSLSLESSSPRPRSKETKVQRQERELYFIMFGYESAAHSLYGAANI